MLGFARLCTRIGAVAASAALFLAGAISCGDSSSPEPPAVSFENVSCQDLGISPPARCGFLIVPENRAEPSDRTIRLAVATIPARAAQPPADPVVFITGGPGESSLTAAELLISAGVNRDRDLILMAQRGTRFSQPALGCPEIDRVDVSTVGVDLGAESTGRLLVDAARACRERLSEEGVDLDAYNTLESAADFADLRRTLKLDQWNLFGHSYGSDLTLTIMREHPEGIRSAVIAGVTPPSEVGLAWTWSSARDGLDAFFDACDEQPSCRDRFPGLAETFTRLVGALEAAPVMTTVPSPLGNGEDVEVLLDGTALVNTMVASTKNPAGLPLDLDRLANGDPGGIAERWAAEKVLDPEAFGHFSHGLSLGVSCSEWVPYESATDTLETGRVAYPDFPADVLIQGPQVAWEREKCAVWNVQKAPAAVRDATESEIPTLVMSGSFDPKTGVRFADIAAKTLPRSTVVVVPGAAHGSFVNSCAEQVLQSFWNQPDDPSTACLADVALPEFAIEGDG